MRQDYPFLIEVAFKNPNATLHFWLKSTKNIYGSAVCPGTNEITRLLQSPNFEALFWY